MQKHPLVSDAGGPPEEAGPVLPPPPTSLPGSVGFGCRVTVDTTERAQRHRRQEGSRDRALGEAAGR